MSFDDRFTYRLNELRDIYGEQIFSILGISQEKLDVNEYSRKFFKNKSAVADISVDGNSNVSDTSVCSYEYEYPKAIQKLNGIYLLWKKMVEDEKFGIKRANKALDMIISGALKVHDLHHVVMPYCYAYDSDCIVQKGLPYIKNIKIGPPKHVFSYVNLHIQFIAYASNQTAGAVGIPSFLVYLDYFARKDWGENYITTHSKELEQHLQSFIFSCNYPFRGSQSSFVNVSIFDKYFLEHLFGNTYYPDMSQPNFESIMNLQKFYARCFVHMSLEQPFTFPVNTANFYRPDDTLEIQDEEFLKFVSDLNCHNGCFNIYSGPLSALSSCCRLRSNLDNAKKEYTNSFGAGGVQIGSHRVVTVNLPRIGYVAKDKEDYVRILESSVSVAQDILDTHRSIVADNIERGKLPLYTYGFMNLAKQYSTIGFIGLNEAVQLMGEDIEKDDGLAFAKVIIAKINAMNAKRTKVDGNIRNVEQIPGESAAVDLAKIDAILYPDKCDYKMYANQFIPLWKTVDMTQRSRLQGQFDSDCDGGSILHVNVDNELTKDQMFQLIKYVCKQGVIYWACNMAQCRCKSCGKLFIGKFDKSPCHDAEVERYLRVVGFLTPVSSWVPERREEYHLRQMYSPNQVNL